MSLNQRRTSEILSHLDWEKGLTRDEVARMIQERDDMDVSDIIRLYSSLPAERRFYSIEEAIDSVDPVSWEY